MQRHKQFQATYVQDLPGIDAYSNDGDDVRATANVDPPDSK